jgi:hypothetical protein
MNFPTPKATKMMTIPHPRRVVEQSKSKKKKTKKQILFLAKKSKKREDGSNASVNLTSREGC